MTVTLDDVRRALALRPHVQVTDATGHRAAVALILREQPSGLELLFIHRAEHPADPWSGQMAFPGGRSETGDAELVATAVRETREEIGLDLVALGRPLGRLSEVRTHLPLGSVPHSVVPFAFAIEGDPELQLNEEVQEALWVPLPFLLDRANRSSYTWVRKGLPFPTPCITFRGRVIWGLTLKIVDELVEALGGRGVGPSAP